MDDGLGTGEEERFGAGDIVTLVMVIVVLVAPLLIHTPYYFEIKSITWLIRMETAEPLRFILTITRVFSFERYLPMCRFVFMVHRLYMGKTRFLRVLVVGLLASIYLPVYENLGGVLYLITAPWDIGLLNFETPTFIPVLVFLLLTRLLPYSKRTTEPEEDQWLNPDSKRDDIQGTE